MEHFGHHTSLLRTAAIICCCIALAAVESHPTSHRVPPFSCDGSSEATSTFAFCNRDLTIDERVRDLLSRLTLDEKITQLGSKSDAVPRLGVPYYNWWSEALHGVAKANFVENGVSFDGEIKAATNFPQVILTAASFDADLWYRIGQAIGKEARAIYNEGQSNGTTFWTPNINIFRDPRWGRGQETPGEDPFVTSQYAVVFIRGIQGDSFQGGELKDGHLLVSACCKHFTAYDLENWEGNNRFTFDAKVTKQDMADTYQPPFQSCIEDGRASGLMCAYNLVNGVPACASYDLLTKTARQQWGFQGYVVSDCDAVSLIYQKQNYTNSHEDAVAAVLKAGMDVNCGSYLKRHTKDAVVQNKVSESDIDRALHNLFSVRMRLGLFNGNPSRLNYGDLGRSDICSTQHRYLSLQAARHGIVLLKNSANLLPLSKASTASLAVIGPNSNDTRVLVGNYAGPPCFPITPYEGLRSYADTKFHEGCQNVNCTTAYVNEAVEIAKSVDHVVLVMGISQDFEAEEHDRDDLLLPGLQQNLITSVAMAAKNPVVLVIFSGGPIDISFAREDCKIGSILWAGYPGEAGGKAIAEIIFGEHNPGGRLPMTWYPQDFTKIPMTDMRLRPDPSSGYPGRTYRFYRGPKVFEFGDGLSYTNYSYRFVSVSQPEVNFRIPNGAQLSFGINLNISTAAQISAYVSLSTIDSKLCNTAKFTVIVSVQNQGNMPGKHPVLLFLRRENASSESPVKQLVGFQTVSLDATQTASVQFEVNPCEHFSRADQDGNMVIDSGTQYLVVGDQQYPISIST